MTVGSRLDAISQVANLQQALSAPETRTEALDLLRGLIERVVLTPAEKGFEVELIVRLRRGPPVRGACDRRESGDVLTR